MRVLTYIFLSILFISIQSCNSTNPSRISKPNILLIVADDLGWNDVGFHGSDIQTPVLDELAKESLELTRFYASAICSPTRAGLLTGKYPDRFNIRGGVFSPTKKGGLPSVQQTLPELLKEAGYSKTAAFGKWHLGHSHIKYHPNNQGFDYFYGHYNGAIDYFTHERNGELDWHSNNEVNRDKGYSTDLVGKEAIKFLEEYENDQPFFAYVAFNAPHSPMQAKEEDLKKYGYDPNKEEEDYPVGGGRSFDEYASEQYGLQGRGNTLRQTFSAMVSSMDDAIGGILTALEENGLDENTIVWFLSDNGGTYRFGGDNHPLRGAKHTQWEGGVRVVSLLRWPGKTAANSKNDQLSSYIDVVPTLLKVANNNADVEFDGIDITPALEGEELPERYLFLGGSGIVSQQWKMNEGELFRIQQDPNEEYNVADDYQEVVERLEGKLEVFQTMRPDEDEQRQPEGWKSPENWTMQE